MDKKNAASDGSFSKKKMEADETDGPQDSAVEDVEKNQTSSQQLVNNLGSYNNNNTSFTNHVGEGQAAAATHNTEEDESSTNVVNNNNDNSPPPDIITQGTSCSQEALLYSPRQIHPLQHCWCLYVMTSAGGKRDKDTWTEQQTLVHEFATVEDFWCMYNNIRPPSEIGNSDYSLFKKGILPAWEDETCKRGGRWLCKLSPKYRPLDDMWLHLILALIGENFEDGSYICGAVVSPRVRQTKVALWISSADDKEAKAIGHTFQDVLMEQAESKRDCSVIFERFCDKKEPFQIDA